jgi:hypothetical protein
MKKTPVCLFAMAALLGALIAVPSATAAGFNFSAHLFQGCFATAPAKCVPNEGEAENVNDSVEQGALLTSFGYLSPGTFGYAGLKFSVPGQPFTFADLTTLQTDYELGWGNCGGGSPRWQITVLTPSGHEANIQVYVGPTASDNGDPCNEAMGTEVNTGNYIGAASCGDSSLRYDDSQLGGSATSDYSATLGLYGSYPVVGLSFVVDGGWSQPQNEQQVFVDQVQVGGTVHGTTSTTTNYPEKTGSADNDSSTAPLCN